MAQDPVVVQIEMHLLGHIAEHGWIKNHMERPNGGGEVVNRSARARGTGLMESKMKEKTDGSSVIINLS
jgi:hypothetical protein